MALLSIWPAVTFPATSYHQLCPQSLFAIASQTAWSQSSTIENLQNFTLYL